MAGLEMRGQRYAGDAGEADPGAASALAAYSVGRGSEHAALCALDGARLLIPVVATRAGDGPWRAGPDGHPGAKGGERGSEVALPLLIGADGRPAVPAFTCLDALRRWRSDARPVPVAAREVWQTALAEAAAVVIDVAGPVPLAVEGARLAALAGGLPAPRPHEDPDVAEAVRHVVGAEGVFAGFHLAQAAEDSDLAVHLVLADGCGDGDAPVLRAMERAGSALMSAVGDRLRRGIEVRAVGGSSPCCAG